MKYLIRKIKREDCEAIARVVTISWNESYRGIVPDSFLNKLQTNEKERAERMYNEFDENINTQLVLEVNGDVVGFANFGISDDEEFQHCGEIFALYIVGKYKGNGFGRKLVEEVVKEIKLMGLNQMIISCLKRNKSNDFYKHIGGKFVKERIYKKLNLPENVYLYDI